MILVLIFITVLYGLLITAFVVGFDKVKNFNINNKVPTTRFSIIIPFKNEVENLPSLLNSIVELNYPLDLFELILVDDNSDDGSYAIINETMDKRLQDKTGVINGIDVKIYKNNRQTQSPKKDAINTAVKQANYEWILTTDADCIVHKNWLKTLNAFIQTHDTNFIAGPVNYYKNNSFFKRFQALDFYSLIGSTIGGFGIQKPFMCNGANLAYKKNLFYKLYGFEGNDTIASGDDIFLLEKALKQNPNGVHYLKSKDAIVTTQAEPNFKSLLNQRLRWAAKASSYNNWFSKIVGLIVLLMNASLVGGFILVFIGVLNVRIFLSVFIFKFLIDFIIIQKTASFFNQKTILSAYVTSSLIYPIFSVCIAILSSFKGYEWKGRQFKK